MKPPSSVDQGTRHSLRSQASSATTGAGIAWGCLLRRHAGHSGNGSVMRTTRPGALVALSGVVSVSRGPCIILNISIRLERDKQMLSEYADSTGVYQHPGIGEFWAMQPR